MNVNVPMVARGTGTARLARSTTGKMARVQTVEKPGMRTEKIINRTQ